LSALGATNEEEEEEMMEAECGIKGKLLAIHPSSLPPSAFLLFLFESLSDYHGLSGEETTWRLTR
jgi:hypothetical protein